MVIRTASMRAAIVQDVIRARARYRRLYASEMKNALLMPHKALRVKSFRGRKSESRPNYMDSTWGRILSNPRFRDPTERRGGKLLELPAFQYNLKPPKTIRSLSLS